MNRRRMIACAGAAALALCLPARTRRAAAASDAVIVTLDGARVEEIFGGLDATCCDPRSTRSKPRISHSSNVTGHPLRKSAGRN